MRIRTLPWILLAVGSLVLSLYLPGKQPEKIPQMTGTAASYTSDYGIYDYGSTDYTLPCTNPVQLSTGLACKEDLSLEALVWQIQFAQHRVPDNQSVLFKNYGGVAFASDYYQPY